MNETNYVILAYAIGLGLLWGQAVLMWMESRSVAARAASAMSAEAVAATGQQKNGSAS